MRIAHIITRLIIGGAQENTLLSCEDLTREYGDDVLLITGPPLGPEGSLVDRAIEWSRAGGRLEVVDALQRPIHPWRDAISYHEIKKAIQRFKPDVVHTHSAKGGILGRATAWSLGVPCIVHTVHGAPFHPWQSRGARWFFQWCERWAARRCHAMVSVADAMTDLMVAANVAPRKKFTTVYSGMEVEPFLQSSQHRASTRNELGYRPEHIVIGKIARLFKLKGHDDVIRAARAVVASNPNVRFLFVGDGILRDALKQQISDAGLAGYFQFTGLVPPDRIPALISAMDIVVHASLREGLARVLPQALISAKPVVSYDIDGAREVTLPGVTGFLIPPRDIEGLSNALKTLAGDPAMCRQFGQEGRRRFTEPFRHQHMTAQLRALYQQVLSCPK
jgi:glycosyltransferase involved in cell wall biosynthesis